MRVTETTAGALVVFGGTLVELVRYALMLLLPLATLSSPRHENLAFLFKAAEYLPNVLLGVFIGALMDSVRSRAALLLSSVIFVTALSALGLGLRSGVNGALLVALCFVCTTACYAFSNARGVYIKRSFAASRLLRLNTLIGAGLMLVAVFGPFLAGLLLRYFNAACSVMMLTSVLVIAATACSLLPTGADHSATRARIPLRRRVSEALIEFQRKPALLRLCLAAALFNMAESLLLTAWILDAKTGLGLTPYDTAMLIAIQLSGGVVGAILFSRTGTTASSTTRIIQTLPWPLFASAICSIVPAMSLNYFSVAVAGFGFILFGTILAINVWTIRQIVTPSEKIGAVSGVSSALFNAGVPAAYFAAPYLFGHSRVVTYSFAMLLILCTLVTVSTIKQDAKAEGR